MKNAVLRILCCLLALVLTTSCMGCQEQQVPPSTPPGPVPSSEPATQPPAVETFSMAMRAVIQREGDNRVYETTVAVTGTTPDTNGQFTLEIALASNEKFEYDCSDIPLTVHKDVIAHYEALEGFLIASTYLKNTNTNVRLPAWVALDLEAGMMMLCTWDENRDMILASSSSDFAYGTNVHKHFQPVIDLYSTLKPGFRPTSDSELFLDMKATFLDGQGQSTASADLLISGSLPTEKGSFAVKMTFIGDTLPLSFDRGMDRLQVTDLYSKDDPLLKDFLFVDMYLNRVGSTEEVLTTLVLDLKSELLAIFLRDGSEDMIVASSDQEIPTDYIVKHFRPARDAVLGAENEIRLSLRATYINGLTGAHIATSTWHINGFLPGSDDRMSLEMSFTRPFRLFIPGGSTDYLCYPDNTPVSEAIKEYTVISTLFYESSMEPGVPVTIVFDFEKDRAVILVHNEQKDFIVACADTTVSPDDLVAYFQPVIDVLR